MYINTRELQHLQKMMDDLKSEVSYIRGFDVEEEHGRNVFTLYSADDLKVPYRRVRAVWIEGGSRFDHFETV